MEIRVVCRKASQLWEPFTGGTQSGWSGKRVPHTQEEGAVETHTDCRKDLTWEPLRFQSESMAQCGHESQSGRIVIITVHQGERKIFLISEFLLQELTALPGRRACS